MPEMNLQAGIKTPRKKWNVKIALLWQQLKTYKCTRPYAEDHGTVTFAE